MYEEELYDQEPYEQETSFVIYEGVVVPESVLMKREKSNPYGSVPGLSDEELADPDELEQQVYREELGPVLRLSEKQGKCWIRPVIEDGHIHWGAFSSVDFDRYRLEFDKARYKSEKLREQLKDLVIMVKIVSKRIPGRDKYKVLKLAKLGSIDIGQIRDFDLYQLAEMYLRALRIRQQIDGLDEKRRANRAERLQKWFEHLDRLPEPG